jgi:hypothetical protein
MQHLAVGTRIYNRGDMANPEHFGTITEVRTDRWGTQYKITPDAESDRISWYWIPAAMFSETDNGNGTTRFVTEAAHNSWRNERHAAFLKWAATVNHA